MASLRISIILSALLALNGFVAKAYYVVESDLNGFNGSEYGGQVPSTVRQATDNDNEPINYDNEVANGLDPESKIEGIPIKLLTIEEVYQLADETDVIDAAKLDILAGQKITLERRNEGPVNQGSRKKRWISVAGRLLFSAGRALFRGARAGRVTSSGTRVTRQYNKPGSYQDAVRDFNRFKPTNRNTFNGKISGESGTFGKHKLTVRDGSKNGGPSTLDIRSPRSDGSTYVRKFRYGGKQ